MSLNLEMTDGLAYVRERWATPRIAALVLMLWLAATATATALVTVQSALAGLCLSALLSAQFRLWDDLADLPQDRVNHPNRVLVRALDVRGFGMGALALSGPIAALLWMLPSGVVRLGAYVLLALATWGLYQRAATLKRRPNWLSRALLLKYAVFVYLLAPEPLHPGVSLAAGGVFFLVLVIDGLGQGGPPSQSQGQPSATLFEANACPGCGTHAATHFTFAQDDLTGKPGRFRFVKCSTCALHYQSPRLRVEHIGAYYQDEYIAHRKKTDWGWLTPFYDRAMNRHDRAKIALVQRYARLSPGSCALDVGCGAGSFIDKIRTTFNCSTSAVDFKDMSSQPWLKGVRFHHGLFYEQSFDEQRFDLITMWHFLEHDYEPLRTLETARELLSEAGVMIIEVPCLDSVTCALYGSRWPGLQAPQHTTLYSRHTLEQMVRRAGLSVIDHLPYGAFPAYFYLFAGLAFKFLRGRGLNLERAIAPYFIGQLLLSPLLLFERRLNLAMQTIVCRRAPQVLR